MPENAVLRPRRVHPVVHPVVHPELRNLRIERQELQVLPRRSLCGEGGVPLCGRPVRWRAPGSAVSPQPRPDHKGGRDATYVEPIASPVQKRSRES